MKIIPLTRGKCAIVDDEDAFLLIKWPWLWNEKGKGRRGYASRSEYRNGKYRFINMEHQIMGPPPIGCIWDHINHDSLDNRRNNLRLATYAQNSANRKKSRGKSRYLGVSPAYGGKWAAMIMYKGTNHYLGVFETEFAAAHARDIKAKVLHGPFAVLNFSS